MENLSEQEIIRREKAKKLETLGVDPFGAKFERTHSALQIKDKAKDKSHEQLEEEKIIVKSAGRIIAIRDMGKAAFFTIQDRDSAIQAYIRKDVVGEEAYQIFGLTDIGDFVGVEGRLMLTKTGEVTIRAEKYFYLTKALRPLPEKFHGLSDIEERYRRRYLDLIVNKEARDIAYIRPKIIRATQNYFDSNGFIEVETPILQPILGGANAKPFSTHHNALDMDFYLRIATELPLKRLIVGGMEKVYEIGRLFRNEGMSNRHNPEFTTIEVYQAYSDMRGMMEVTEGVIRYIATTVFQKTVFEYNGKEIDLGKPFEKRTMVDLVKEYSGVDFSNNYTVDQAKQLAKEHNVKIEKHYSVGHIINAFFETFAEDKLVQPIFVCEHPIEVSPLAKKARDPRFADRFELFIDGREYANAYSELNDPIDQRQRFESQVKEKSLGNDEACEMDVDFVEALEYGMPPTGGLGIGLDRLIMLLTGAATIREILLFPHMKIRN